MHKKVSTFMRSDVFLILDAISLSKTLTLMFDHILTKLDFVFVICM